MSELKIELLELSLYQSDLRDEKRNAKGSTHFQSSRLTMEHLKNFRSSRLMQGPHFTLFDNLNLIGKVNKSISNDISEHIIKQIDPEAKKKLFRQARSVSRKVSSRKILNVLQKKSYLDAGQQ